MLCILDNCEHLIDACAELAEAVIAHPGPSRVLATSREPLGIPGEQVYLVPSLDPRSDGIQLFATRAAEARAGFVLDDATAETVAQICERLDGIPLAIELAAARVNQLAPAQLLDRLDDRFRVLTGGRRRVQRQQTLAAALDWSHDLLDEQEQVLLRRLAVFPASFSIEAAEAVTDVDAVLALGPLVAKSLVQVIDDSEQFRYRLLESVRLYATDKLVAAGEADELRARHARWVRESLEEVPLEARWMGDDVGVLDLNDVRAALEWSAAAGTSELTAQLASGVNWTRFDQWREGIRWCEGVADNSDLEAHAHLQVLMMLIQLHTYDLSGREQWIYRAETVAEGVDGPLVGFMWSWRGSTAAVGAAGSDDAAYAELAAEWMEIGVAMSKRFALPWQIFCRLNAGFGYTTLGQADAAEHHLEAAIRLSEPLEGYDGLGVAVRGCLSIHRVLAGDLDRALALTDGIAELPNVPVPYREGQLAAVVSLAATGDLAAARRLLRASYEDVIRTGLPLGVDQMLVYGAAVAGVCENWDSSARLLGASQQGWRRSPFSYVLYVAFRDRARAALGIDRARQLRDEGRRMPRDEAVAEALGDATAGSAS
jgi:predicted ATPase